MTSQEKSIDDLVRERRDHARQGIVQHIELACNQPFASPSKPAKALPRLWRAYRILCCNVSSALREFVKDARL
jgi:hypothetical protein